MSRRLSVLVLSAALASSGCLASWFRQLRENPVAALQEGVGFISNAAGLADLAFNTWASANPDGAEGARLQFSSVMGNVRRGLEAAQSGLRVAARAQGPSPDANNLLRDARDAMTNMNAFLQGLGGPAGRASSPIMQQAVQATAAAAQPL